MKTSQALCLSLWKNHYTHIYFRHIQFHNWLVVSHPSEKYESQLARIMTFPTVSGKSFIKAMFQSTNQTNSGIPWYTQLHIPTWGWSNQGNQGNQGTHRQHHETRCCRDHQGPNLWECLPQRLHRWLEKSWVFTIKTGHFSNKNAGRIGFHGDLMMILWGFSEDLMGV